MIYNIPDGWKKTTLNTIGKIVGGGTPSTKVKEYYDNGTIPWLTPKDLSNYNKKYISKGERNITELGLQKSSAKLYPKGTVIFSSRAPIGYVAIASNDVSTNQGFKSIIPNCNVTTSDFVYYLLKYNTDKIKNVGSGSTFAEVSGKVMKEFEILLPTYKDQIAIANLLSSFDDKIENNNAIIANLEEQAQTIFKSWFVDFEPFQDEEFIESELGEIPQSFKVQCISDFASISSGKRRKNADRTEQNKYPIVGATKVTGYTDEYLTEDKVIITGRVGTLGSFQLFKSKIWPSDNTLVLKSDMFGFTYFSLKQVNYKALNRGSTQPLVTQTDIKNSKVAMPDINLLNTFESLVDPMIEMYWKLSEQNKRLSEIRDTLLPKLMSGEIRVEEVDTVE